MTMILSSPILRRVTQLTVLTSIALMSSNAKAQSCIGQFADLEQHNGIISATVTITQSNGTVSYAKFFNLVHSPSVRGPSGVPTFAKFSGRAFQLFNDRDQSQPFPVSKKDDLGIDIKKSVDNVMVIFTLITWNNGKMGFTASCNGGLMYGYSDRASYAISFQKSPPI